MDHNQSSETVTTVTEENLARSAGQTEPTRPSTQTEPYRASNQAEPFRTADQPVPVRTTSQVDTVRKNHADSRNQTATITRVVYWLLSILEGLLAIRLILKLLGASTSSSFVSLIYSITGFFAAPFAGIFKTVESGFETSTLIAMIVYALVGWGIAKLVAIVTNTSSANN